MRLNKVLPIALIGFCAGAVNSLFGTGGGMILVPLMSRYANLEESEIFPSSVCIILPICIISLICSFPIESTLWALATPYLIASAIGGLLAGFFSKKIPTLWLHRVLGIFVIAGGIRYLC